MKIVKAELKDAADILKLQKSTFAMEAKINDDYNIKPLIENAEDIEKAFEKQSYIKIVDNGRIIGSARGYIENGICYIGRVIVDEQYQNMGLGTRLMKAIEDIFNSADRYELFTGKKSSKNIYFYEKLGYKIFKEERISDKTTLVYMEKYNV